MIPGCRDLAYAVLIALPGSRLKLYGTLAAGSAGQRCAPSLDTGALEITTGPAMETAVRTLELVAVPAPSAMAAR